MKDLVDGIETDLGGIWQFSEFSRDVNVGRTALCTCFMVSFLAPSLKTLVSCGNVLLKKTLDLSTTKKMLQRD